MNDEIDRVVDEYFRKLEALILTFDFTRAGHQESMGKDAAGIVAEGIMDRSISAQGGANAAWLPNDADYTADKVKRYNVSLIGVRTGQMISLPSLLGRVEIEPQLVTIRYGTGKAPTQSMSSTYISTSDRKVTDTDKAGYFTEKKGPFFEPDEVIAEAVHAYFVTELGIFIGELNAR